MSRPKPAGPPPVVDVSDPERLNKVLAELDELPGLEEVAGQVRAMANRAMLDTRRREAGLPVAEAGYHATFIGPAGTGKNTVARVWGKALAAMGVLPSGHTVEVDRGFPRPTRSLGVADQMTKRNVFTFATTSRP